MRFVIQISKIITYGKKTMIEIIIVWITVAILGVTLAAPLGPVNAEMIKQGLNKSISHKSAWIAAILTGVGAMNGDFIVATTALMVGGEILIDVFSSPFIKLCLFSINIIILGYLGISTLIQNPEPQINFSDEPETPINKQKIQINQFFFIRRYITGLSLVISSPWSYLWWVSAGTIILFSDFNVPDFFSRMGLVIMFLSGILLWVISFCTLLAIIGKSPNPKYFKWITKGSAFILLLFAGIIVKDAWESLLELLEQV
jgi:threonine/homoserine/homoserine lactone efflux protein